MSKVIDHSPIGLSPEQQQRSRERLTAVKIHPRDTLANRNLLARLEKAWAQSLGDTRGQIGVWLEEFEKELASQQESRISPLRQRLEGLLAELTL
jgi:molecular chaperone HscC